MSNFVSSTITSTNEINITAPTQQVAGLA